MSKMRVLIVDDEPLARRRIAKLLEAHPDVEIVGQCANGLEAATAIEQAAPDLVFLDVQMPGADGFRVIERVGPQHMPAVVFITAFDQYALRAFDVNALDYLLKPFDADRFAEAIDRARREVARRRGGASDLERRLQAALDRLPDRDRAISRIAVRCDGRVIFVPTEQIDWIEAEGKYVRLHCGKQVHLLLGSIGRLEGLLDPQRFTRIHRSTIVNMDRIAHLEPGFHGEWRVILGDGTSLLLSRGYRDQLCAQLGPGL